MHSIVKLV